MGFLACVAWRIRVKHLGKVDSDGRNCPVDGYQQARSTEIHDVAVGPAPVPAAFQTNISGATIPSCPDMFCRSWGKTIASSPAFTLPDGVRMSPIKRRKWVYGLN